MISDWGSQNKDKETKRMLIGLNKSLKKLKSITDKHLISVYEDKVLRKLRDLKKTQFSLLDSEKMLIKIEAASVILFHSSDFKTVKTVKKKLSLQRRELLVASTDIERKVDLFLRSF